MSTRAPSATARVSDVFLSEMVVRGDDIDALGHASNVAYVRWVQDIARAHSEHVGWDHRAYRAAGVVFVVRRHEVDYLRPALEGQLVVLRTWIESWTAATSMRRTELSFDDQVIARAATLWALVSTKSGRPCRIPPDIQGAFRRSDAA